MHKFSLQFLLALLLFSPIVLAQDQPAKTETPAAPQNATQIPDDPNNPFKIDLPLSWQDLTFSDFLGVSESYNFEKPQFAKTVENYSDITSVERTFDDLQKFLDEYRLEWKGRLKLSSWDLNSVMKFKMEMGSLFEMSKQEKQGYFDFVNKTDVLVASLKEKRVIFENFYRKAQQDEALRTQVPVMKNYVDDINGFLVEIQKLQLQYAKVYKEKSKIIESMEVFGNQIDDEINGFREMRFEKTVPAFYEDEFRSFFNEATIQSLREAWARIISYPFSTLHNRLFDFVKFALFFLGLGFLLHSLKRSDRKRPVFLKPFVLAFALSLIGFRVWTQNQTVVGDLMFWFLLIACTQLLLATFVRQDADRRGLRWLICVYGFLQLVNAVGIPQVLYRVLLVFLPMLLVVYGYIEVKNDKQSNRKALLWMMKVLIGLCFATSVAELTGYHLLAVLLFQGTLQSVFAIFIGWQVRYVFFKLLFSAFTFLGDHGFSFFENFKTMMLRKLRFLTDVLGIVLLTGLLLSIWGFHANWWQGVLRLWDWGFSFQDFHVTLGRVLQSWLILYFTHFLSYLATHYLDDVLYPRKGVPIGSAKAINALINYLAWVIGLFGAFSALGFALEQFAIIAGALSVGIGFGLQNIVNNFVSGLILLFERPIKVGDLVNLNGEIATIEKVGLRSTVIRTAAKTQMIVPNSDLITQRVENLTLSDKDFRILIPLGVAYGSNTQLVKQTLQQVAAGFGEIKKNPAPQVVFVGFGESALNFELWAWIDDVSTRRDIVSEINYKIDEEFRKAKIEIPFPQRDVHIRNGTV